MLVFPSSTFFLFRNSMVHIRGSEPEEKSEPLLYKSRDRGTAHLVVLHENKIGAFKSKRPPLWHVACHACIIMDLRAYVRMNLVILMKIRPIEPPVNEGGK